jgi:predicted Zn-dependent protease
MALTLEHEFGHVLGLGHDDFRTSVMFPEITNESITIMRMTDNDRKLLRGLYCD